MSTNQERVHALFTFARFLAVEDRKAYLDKECVDNAELREEVESLLKYAPTSAGTREIGTIALGEKDVVDHRYEAGNRIGEYEIKSELGEGGFGIVYFAKQHEPVEREVAIKVLHSNRCTDTFILGFEAERQTLANMSHPGIAHFYDAGLTEHNQPFFVMEFVSGQPITEYCNEHRLSIKQRLALFADVCKAVQHAHTKGVIHRDLTPNNILVSTSEDGSPRAQIIDFGIARKTDEETADVMGTLMYMSPEQATKDASVDTRSDIYTLGVVLYELLVGKPPLDREMFKDAALQAQLKLVKEQDSPTPSTKLSGIGDSDETAAIAEQRQENLVSLLKMLRRELDWIPRRALQKDPERRYATASEFGEDISRYLKDEVVVAVPDSASYRFKKTMKRHKGVYISVAIVFIVLLAGVIGTASGWKSAHDNKISADVSKEDALVERNRAVEAEAETEIEKTIALLERDKAEEAKLDLEKLADALIEILLTATIDDAQTPANVKMLEASHSAISELEGLPPIIQAKIDLSLGIASVRSGDLEKAKSLLIAARDVFIREFGEDDEHVALAGQYLISIQIKDNDFKPIGQNQKKSEYAHEWLDNKVETYFGGFLPTNFMNLLIELGHVSIDAYFRLNEREKAAVLKGLEGISSPGPEMDDILKKLQQAWPKVIILKEKPEELAELTGPLLTNLLKPAKSMGVSLSILYAELDIDSLSPESSAVLLGLLMISRQDDKAMELWRTSNKFNRTALEIFEKYFGILKIDGHSLSKEGDFLGAESEFRNILVLSTTIFGEQSMASIEVAYELGKSISKQKNHVESEAVFRKWLEISKNALGENHSTTLSLKKYLDQTLEKQKNTE